MAENLAKLQVSRAAYRTHLTQTIKKSTNITTKENDSLTNIITNQNYAKALQLLKQRFGNPTKVIHAHMQSLLDIPNPKYELASLQLFYDTMETHIRGLESLGKSHNSYGDLLVPIVLGKLPHQIRTNLARDHDSPEWKFKQLRESILKEIRILEAGIQPNPMQATLPSPRHATMGSFSTQTNKNLPTARHKFAYCKGPHPTTVMWSKIVKKGVFQLLGKA